MTINPAIEVIARAVIISGDQLLTCQTKGTEQLKHAPLTWFSNHKPFWVGDGTN